MTSNCKWYFKTSDLATVNQWVVIKTTTLNKFVSFSPKNGSCNLSARPETDFSLEFDKIIHHSCLLYTSPSPRDATLSRMPSSA